MKPLLRQLLLFTFFLVACVGLPVCGANAQPEKSPPVEAKELPGEESTATVTPINEDAWLFKLEGGQLKVVKAGEKTGTEESAAEDESQVILTMGDRGSLVAAVQRTLHAQIESKKLEVRYGGETLDRLRADGWYGPKTREAVLAFQKRSQGKDGEELDLTGDVDVSTLQSLEPLAPSNVLLQWIMSKIESEVSFDNSDSVKQLAALLACIPIIIVAIIIHRFAKAWIVRLTKFLAQQSTTTWDDALVEQNFFGRAAQFAPAAVIYFAAGIFDEPQQVANAGEIPYVDVFHTWYVALTRIGLAYMVIAGAMVTEAFVRSCDRFYAQRRTGEANPVKGFVQALRILIYFVCGILLVSVLSGHNPLNIAAGLGAFMAVILLVFKDSLLGLVASVHIVANNLVKVGDWIEMPKYGADGDVLDITLGTVKVQNWDKTISTIPTYALMSESFRNWSGMSQSGGRRIKRCLRLDMDSIRVCTPEMVEQFKKIELLTDYVRAKNAELEQYNHDREVEASVVNSRRLTNIGTFRAYVVRYLKSHADIHQEMTLLVRQLQPTEVGLPIEIYAFCNDTAWVKYEDVQADIFDHLLAVLPEFGLRAFQDVTNEVPEACVPCADDRRSDPERQIQREMDEQNQYLQDHPRASVRTALRKVTDSIDRAGLADQLTVTASGRTLQLE